MQMLANCFAPAQLADPDCPRTKKGTVRKHSNPNHPSCLFVRKSKDNMQWLIEHCRALIDEKHRRYPKGGTHFALYMLQWVEKNIDQARVPNGDLTDFSVAIKEDKKCRQVPGFDKLPVVEQYKLYYIHDKVEIARWFSVDQIPNWWPYNKLDFVVNQK